jgi:hypothetical protein
VFVKWPAAVVVAMFCLTAAACDGSPDGPGGPSGTGQGGGLGSDGSANAPVRVCGNDDHLGGGPASAPEGAVVVPAGDNSSVDFTRPGKTYWFAPGTHTFGPGAYGGIEAADDARYVGAPGAVLDGRKTNRYAFTGDARGVTVEHLTVKRFGPKGSNNNEGVVNHDSGDNWTIAHNTISENAGAGVMLGSGNVLRYNCLTRNEQYGFNAYSEAGPRNVTLDHNELSYNNTYDWEAKIEGCGCTGGGKFWSVDGATVTSNFVHHNFGVGLWADNNNRGFLFENNVVADNADVGILYETSYNALVRDNELVRNGLKAGPENPGFPTGAIYVSESGGDSRVAGRYSGRLAITGNRFEDNWSGVVLWENADRYCGSPANTSTGECTLVNPETVTVKTCNADNIAREPYYSDCRWKTQNVEVRDNVFRLSRGGVGSECSLDQGCGFNAVMSNYGSYPDWSPYKGTVVQKAITYRQGNVFRDNTYRGPWRFMPVDQSNVTTFDAWQRSPYGQDRQSTLTPSASPAAGRAGG